VKKAKNNSKSAEYKAKAAVAANNLAKGTNMTAMEISNAVGNNSHIVTNDIAAFRNKSKQQQGNENVQGTSSQNSERSYWCNFASEIMHLKLSFLERLAQLDDVPGMLCKQLYPLIFCRKNAFVYCSSFVRRF